MVKRRTPANADKNLADQIENFASGADKTPLETEAKIKNINAKRDYKAISVPFNEYEYKQLELLAEKTGRTKLNAIRWAILKMAEEER